jgi:hypothetical protein
MFTGLVWVLAIFAILIGISIQSLFTGITVLLCSVGLALIVYVPLKRVYSPEKQQAVHMIIAGLILILASAKNVAIKTFLARAQLTQEAIGFNLSQVDVILVVVGYFCTTYILTTRQEKLSVR